LRAVFFTWTAILGKIFTMDNLKNSMLLWLTGVVCVSANAFECYFQLCLVSLGHA